MLKEIDVCMPTYNSGGVIDDTLASLAVATDAADLDVNQLIILDNESCDETADRIERLANEYDWELLLRSEPLSLPEARELAVELVETEWFLFLDDDVRIEESYLVFVSKWTENPRIGAVQGRKRSRVEHTADWVRRRMRRGGTHATLIRKASVAGVSIPDGIVVLEDEFLRRVVEGRNYRWILEPMARFTHETQERHTIGWTEGYVGGKYALSQGHTVALNVPFAVLTGRNPLPHLKRAMGWMAGRLVREETANAKTAGADDGDMEPNADGTS